MLSSTLHYGVRVCSLLASCLFGTLAFAGDLPPADRPISRVIDDSIQSQLKQQKITPAPQIDDANLIRRLTLDLVGRIPTPLETEQFIATKESNKREQLVDRLMQLTEFVDHQVNEFDWLLMQGSGSLREYLQTAFKEERSWERMFRELISLKEDDKGKIPVDFVKQRVKDLDRLTNDVSSIFFGVNISCAQCHDHPLAPDWKQEHFYGLKSFLNRTYDNGGFLGEREYGNVSFLTPKGEQRQAHLMFLTGKRIEEPEAKEPNNDAKKKEQELLKELATKKQPPPKPSFSRREQLVSVALEPDQRHFFARSIVNRLWYRLIGYGLVMPVDQMHSGNPASHPELLDWLARDMADHQFNLARLIRGIALSETYSRSSRWEKGDRPLSSTFAVADVRPLTPYQYGSALRIATTDPEVWPKLKYPVEFSQRTASISGSGRAWASLFQPVGDNFQIGVSEPLMFANDERVAKELLTDSGDRILLRLKELPSPEEQVRCAVSTVLGRPATNDEVTALAKYLASRSDRKIEALQQVLWSLLTSSEFRFNY